MKKIQKMSRFILRSLGIAIALYSMNNIALSQGQGQGPPQGMPTPGQQFWKIQGNTISSTDFLGTLNPEALQIRVNNVFRATFSTNGKFGLRNPNPTFDIEVAYPSSSLVPEEFPCVAAINTNPDLGTGATFNIGKLLCVAGNGAVAGALVATYGDGTSGIGQSVSLLSASNHPITFFTNTEAVSGLPLPAMIIQTNGDVGIGTTSVSSKLTVAGAIESTFGGIKFPDGTSQITAATTDDGDWTGAGTGTMFATNLSDNVGIGTDLVSSKLTVAGTIETSTGIKFGDGTTQITAAITDDNDWQGAGTGAMLTANFNDKVGIRSDFPPVFDLQVAHASTSNDAQQFPCIISLNTDPTIGSAASGTFNFSKVLTSAGGGIVNGGLLASFGDGTGGIGTGLTGFHKH